MAPPPSCDPIPPVSLVHSLKWSFLAELTSKAITPVIFIVLARLLTPEDFGVMTAAVMVIAFSQIFWEAGMGKALIQRQTDVEDAANVAFWVNIALGILIASLLFWAAEPIATTFFHDQRVTAVLRVMTLQVLLGSLSSVQTALIQKEMGFKKLFWVRLITVAFPGWLPFLWPGADLDTGPWFGDPCWAKWGKSSYLWRVSGWRPTWRFPTDIARDMGQFGIWVGASGVLAWFYGWADSLIVGKYLGTHELGLYRTGNLLAAMAFSVIFGPIGTVLYSHLSKMDKDRIRLKAAIEKVIRVTILIAVPSGFVMFFFSEQIGLALFGSEWNGIGFVIGVMALMHGFSWVAGMNGEVYRAMGKPSYETIVTAVTIVVYFAAYIYTIKIGFEVFVWNRLILTLGAMYLHLYIIKMIIGLRIFPVVSYLGGVTVVAILTVSFVKWIVLNIFSGAWPQLFSGSLLSFLLFSVMIYAVERNRMVMEVMSLVKGRNA